MFKNAEAFSGFSVSDIEAAKVFYGETLGLDTTVSPQGLDIHLHGGGEVFLYPKQNHIPATYTALNFKVDDIDQAVDGLTAKGVVFEHYDQEYMKTDAKGIVRSDSAEYGPKAIAWFTDPADNILAVIQEK